MRRLVPLAVLLGLVLTVPAATQLPESRRLAGPLDSGHSAFGDEFFNFPDFFMGKAAPGTTHLSGWLEIRFGEPVGSKVDFTLHFDAVGTDDEIAFPGGAMYTLVRNRAFSSELRQSRGTLDLGTGEVEIEVHAIFQNSVIARVDKNIRIPYGFPNDYPPVVLPVPLPFSDRPPVFREARFMTDPTGRISGFEFRGETIAPVTLFPQLGLFPPYAFGESGAFYFANPTGCLPGAPPQNCPTDETNPDGPLLPKEAFFHPHFEMVSTELREVSELRPVPCGAALASGGGLVGAGGRLYHLGGFDGERVSGVVQVFDPVSSQWGQAAPVPFPLLAAQSIALGSRIYLIGGWDVSTELSANLVQIFDVETNQWTVQALLPVPVAGGVAALVEGKIYVIGGWSNDPAGTPILVRNTQVFDPISGTWTLGAQAPLATAGSSAAVVGASIYLINGLTHGDAVTDQIWIYNSNTNNWSQGPRTPRGVYEAAAVHIDNRIYLVGGRQAADGPVDSQRMQILELALNAWREGHQQPLPTAASAVGVLDGKFFIAGGRTMAPLDPPPGDVTDVVQFYDPSLGWSVCDSRPVFSGSSILNAASGIAGPPDLSPGSRGVILGYNFASSTESAAPLRFEEGRLTRDLPDVLNGVSVRVDGKPAPVLFVSPTRVEFQFPFEVSASTRNRRLVQLELLKQGSPRQSPPVFVPVLAAAPSIFVYHYGELLEPDFLDRASAIARNSDGRLNHPSQPARPGDTITLLLTGLGLVDPDLGSGRRAQVDPPNESIFDPRVTIAGREANVLSVNLAPNEVGVYELTMIIPPETPRRNNVEVVVTVNSILSNRAMISVR